MTEEVKKRPRPDARVKQWKRPDSHFAKLSQTPEGRAQLAEWRSRRKKLGGRPHGAADGTTRKTRAADMKQAKAQAQKDLKRMAEKGYEIPKDQYALEGITTVLEVMRLKDIAPKDKLAAASKLLEYTMAKPAAETNVTLKKAEDFLADLAKEEDE